MSTSTPTLPTLYPGSQISEWQNALGEFARQYRTKKEQKPAFLFAHAHEEVSEAWKEWREGRIETTFEEVRKHGVALSKPEGLGAELADMIGMALLIADLLHVDLESEMLDKWEYLRARLEAKLAKKGKK